MILTEKFNIDYLTMLLIMHDSPKIIDVKTA